MLSPAKLAFEHPWRDLKRAAEAQCEDTTGRSPILFESQTMFFESWASLLRVLLSGVLCYCSLIVLLRIFGKRTLSKMNAFDFIVTVALGSTLASILLNNSIPIVNGVASLGAITWASVRSEKIRSLVKSEPTALVLNGSYLESAMRQQRVTRDEVEAALREHGNASVSEIACVVLETDGSLTVVPRNGKVRGLGEPDFRSCG